MSVPRMNSSPRINQEVYRLIATRRVATELLLNTNERGQRLPQASVRSGERLAVQLVEGLRNRYGLDAYCLFVPRFSITPETATQAKYVVMESVAQNGDAPAGTCWVPRSSITLESSLSGDEWYGLKSSLEEMDGYAEDPLKWPFAKAGAIQKLFDWTQEQIDPLDLKLTGGFEQLNAGPSFSLIRIETTGRALWFKATGGETNFHELGINCTLARLFPSYLPELLGVHSSWNGWLSRECHGRTLDSFTEVSAWTQTAETLARLEIASIGKSPELLESGCKNLRLTAIARQIDPFLARMGGRMALQKSEPPAILSTSDLAFLRDELEEACSSLQELGLPDVLGHIDFNPGNVVVSLEKCVFLDWAEGSVGSPFITFCYLREHARRTFSGTPRLEDEIATAYLGPWQSLLAPSEIARAMALSPIVAVFAYALTVDQQSLREVPESAASAGFLRSLARRMHREAVTVKRRSELCRQ